MSNSIVIRKPKHEECTIVLDLVGTVVHEIYGHLFADDSPKPIDPEPWLDSWVAIVEDGIAGVLLATENNIKDLWILKQYRNNLIGSRLLAQGEAQVHGAGYRVGKLRVNAENETARRFYKNRGWKDVRLYPHESWGFEMVDMEKHF